MKKYQLFAVNAKFKARKDSDNVTWRNRRSSGQIDYIPCSKRYVSGFITHPFEMIRGRKKVLCRRDTRYLTTMDRPMVTIAVRDDEKRPNDDDFESNQNVNREHHDE